jgi:hypothetical protein
MGGYLETSPRNGARATRGILEGLPWINAHLPEGLLADTQRFFRVRTPQPATRCFSATIRS